MKRPATALVALLQGISHFWFLITEVRAVVQSHNKPCLLGGDRYENLASKDAILPGP